MIEHRGEEKRDYIKLSLWPGSLWTECHCPCGTQLFLSRPCLAMPSDMTGSSPWAPSRTRRPLRSLCADRVQLRARHASDATGLFGTFSSSCTRTTICARHHTGHTNVYMRIRERERGRVCVCVYTFVCANTCFCVCLFLNKERCCVPGCVHEVSLTQI